MSTSNLLERFLRYVKIPTPSNAANPEGHPSDPSVFKLAHVLESELKALGLTEVECTENAIVYGVMPPTAGKESSPKIGFMAHMDTVGEQTGKTVVPVVHEKYDGEDLDLGARVLKVSDFPYLAKLKGKTLITTDGNSLLGADDKAGVAEIMEMLERIVRDNIPHGRIAVAFTPDEEIGHGTDCFDVGKFGCDFAYTVDGGLNVNELVYDNFNASKATFTVKGVSVHTGGAKGIMKNAALIAMEINAALPAWEVPSHTCMYEGFFHLESMSGNVENAKLVYLVRDHNAGHFAAREETLRHIAKSINEKYGAGTVDLVIDEQYRNMLDKVLENPKCIEVAKAAMKSLGIEAASYPIRGGTDGSWLAYMGLVAPNLGTGGGAYHGPYEHAVLENMEQTVNLLTAIVRIA